MIADYPALWAGMVLDWRRPGGDRAWLLYSANYLCRTAGVRWALDPLTLRRRLPAAPDVDLARDLQGLSFVLLTHRHADHLDLDLVHRLREAPVRWVVPFYILDAVTEAGLLRKKVLVARPGEAIRLEGITIRPFDGLHWDGVARPDESPAPASLHGVPATGYCLEFNGKRWLFPGDTRFYDASRLPSFGPLDGLFAPLWLGRGAALAAPPPLLDAFCRFCLDLAPRRIVVTHLRELGRPAADYWDDGHYRRVGEWFVRNAPGLRVDCAYMGDSVEL
jgi:L-ascorbate metabolism protein UlaG (beta-lactamase superfamily)